VAVGGATGAVLGRSLRALRDLVSNSLYVFETLLTWDGSSTSRVA
jgi:hypothetical protein